MASRVELNKGTCDTLRIRRGHNDVVPASEKMFF